MARQNNRLVLFIAVLVVFMSAPSLFAQKTYHIGTNNASGTNEGNDYYFDSLEEMRIATATVASSWEYNLVDGDAVVLYKDDNSLTKELGIADKASVTVKSSDSNTRRTITPQDLQTTPCRFFNMNRASSDGSTLSIENLVLRGGYDGVDVGGGAIHGWWHNNISLKNASFENNISNVGSGSFSGAGGGAIYYWDALNCHIIDTDFIGNKTNGSGGALLINASGSLSMSDTTNITLEVTEGKTSQFSGNVDGASFDVNGNYIEGTGTLNSIDFTGSAGKTANFEIITGKDATLDMQDPFRTNATTGSGYTVNITKTGVGSWKLGGNSTVDGSRATTILISEGTLEFYKDAALNAIGTNDSFTVKKGATAYINGGNTITGTTVKFEPGAFLEFDMNFFSGMTDTEKKSTPMLFLDGDTLTVTGTTIRADNLAANPNGDYLLIRGDKPLLAGEFRLYLDGTEVDVSGNRSKRFGYALDNTNKEEELILHIQDFENAIVKWQNNGDSKYTNRWSIYGQNWILPYRNNEADSFVPGDTVIFDDYVGASGTQTVTLRVEDQLAIVIAPNQDGVEDYYLNNGIGMRVSGGLDWVFQGSSITDDDARIAAVLFDGSGSLTFNNTNTYRGGTILAGTGTMYVGNMNQIGSGTIRFWDNNNSAKASRLEFTQNLTLDRQLLVKENANGLVTSSSGVVLTASDLTATQGAVASITGGKLVFEGADGPDSFLVSGNMASYGGAVSVEAGVVQTTKGVFESVQTTFSENLATFDGGAIHAVGSDVRIKDSIFQDNAAGELGGALYFDGSNGTTLTVEAGASGQTVFSGNTQNNAVAAESNAIYMVGGKMVVDVEKGIDSTTGLVDMQDSFVGVNGTVINKTGEGKWKVNGLNTLSGAGSQLTIQAGVLEMSGNKNATETVSQIDLVDGDFSIKGGGTLLVNGGNVINAQSVTVEQNAKFAFNMKDVQENNDSLLNIQATNWSGTDWTQTVYLDLIDFSAPSVEDGDPTRKYNLMDINASGITGGIDQKSLIVQYDGTDMTKLRENFSELSYQNGTLSIGLSAPKNGLTVWNSSGNGGVWDQETFNWSGTGEGDNDITGTERFLGGDAVRFGDQGAGMVSIDFNGVRVADQQNGKAGFTVSNSLGNDYTFSGGSIRGDARFVKTGDGNVLFTDSNDFSKGSSIQGGTVTVRKTTSLGSGDIAMQSSGTGTTTLVFDINSDSSGEMVQNISGNGLFRKTGNGSLKITESNASFVGQTEIRGGELVFGDLNALGSNMIDTGNATGSGTLVLDNVSGSFGKQITGTGGFRATGSNTNVKLTGINNYSGNTTIDAGARIEIAGFNNIGTGNVQVDGTLDMQFAQDQSFDDRTFIGSGNIIKNGNGTLYIGNETAFSGVFTMNSGDLQLGDGEVLKNATFDFKGGTFDYQGSRNLEFGALSGGTSSSGRKLDLNLENDRGLGVTMTIGGNNTDQTYSGTISGKGNVVKTGSGEQVFEGKNTYQGGTLISEGTLVGTDVESFGSGSIVNNGNLDFRIDDYSGQVYEKIIEGTGSVTKSGTGDLTLKGEQKYRGGTIVDNGKLIVETVKSLGMNIDSSYDGALTIRKNGSLVVDIDAATTDLSDTTLSGVLTGSGTLVKEGEGILSIGSAKEFKGQIDHNAGTLFVDGSIGSSIQVGKNAILSGWGNVDNFVRFMNGSVHRIDSRSSNGLGEFKADNIAYEGGSTIYIKVGANGTDRVVADDSINFAKGGGEVNVRLINVGWTEKAKNSSEDIKSYEIFSSEGGILALNDRKLADGKGEFKDIVVSGVDGKVSFLADESEGITVLGYSVQSTGSQSKGIFLDLSVNGTATSYLNQNQLNTLGGIASGEIYDHLYARTQTARSGMLNQMMPMIHTAMPFLTNRAVTQFNAGTFERLRFLRDPVHIAACPVEGRIDPLYRDRGKPSYRCSELDIWFQNYGDFILMQSKGDTPEFRADSYGFNLGIDSGVTRYSSVGIGFGGHFSDVRANEYYQNADIESGLFSLYGDWANESGWMISAAGGFVYSKFDIERNVYDMNTQLSSRHYGLTTFLSIEGSKKFLFGRYELTPYIGVDAIWLHEKAHSERAIGDPSLALRVQSNNTNSILSTMGLRLGRCFTMLGGNIVSPTVYAAWVHNYNVGQVITSARFAGEDYFSIRGASMYRDRAKIGTNLNMTLNRRMDMYTRFDAELGDHMTDISVHLGFRLGF